MASCSFRPIRMISSRRPLGFAATCRHLGFEPSKTAQIFFSTSTSMPRIDPDIPSARSQFKSIDVNPSVLKYIERIGVGKPNRPKRRRRRDPSHQRHLSLAEEEEQLGRGRRRRPQTASTAATTTATVPPPPFAPSTRGTSKESSGKSIRQLPVKLLARVGQADSFPKPSPNLPEVAIAGRSNVGKSTLLNALLYGSRKSVLDDEEAEGSSSSHRRLRRPKPTRWTAKLPRGLKATTSARPGETREISFYQRSSNVDDSKVSIVLVDLPGYGFAFASPEREAEWQSLMKSYLLGRGKSLKRILLLIDARHGMKKADFDFLQSMQDPNLGIETTNIDKDDHRSSSSSKSKTMKTNVVVRRRDILPPIQLVLTKCDLVSQVDLVRRVGLVQQQLSDSLRRQPSSLPVMFVSAQVEGQAGVLELQRELAALTTHRK